MDNRGRAGLAGNPILCSANHSVGAGQSQGFTGLSRLERIILKSAVNIKEEARRLIERLPENMTWDDLMHQIYVRQSIENGLADSAAERLTNVNEVRAKFGLESHESPLVRGGRRST